MGLSFPPSTDNKGNLSISNDDELPLQSIRQVASVRIGDVLFEPSYGSDLGIFESSPMVLSGISTALNRWLEPEYWAVVTSEPTEQMLREDIIEWLPRVISIVPTP